jgi:SAM-dependent methyltransferase
MQTSSSLRTQPLGLRIREAVELARMHASRRQFDPGRYPYDALLAEYSAILQRYGRPSIDRLRILEIGFGARPFRLAWLFSCGLDVTGVDLEEPLTRLTPQALAGIVRKSGWTRAAKSAVRYYLSDVSEWKFLKDLFRKTHNGEFRLPADRLIVSDATSDVFWDQAKSFGLIYTEDVLEHIPKENLGNLAKRMAEALRPNGLAIIRPCVFTGITGGHHLEWYPHRLPDSKAIRHTEPWEHLRQGRRPANTFLNGMTRRDYVELFAPHFDILENRIMNPDLGREYMTDAIRAELSAYGEDELFSNQVLFVLVPRGGQG